MTTRKRALQQLSNPTLADRARCNLGHARYVLDNFGLQLHVNDLRPAGLTRAGRLYFPTLGEQGIVGFQFRPDQWMNEVKPRLDRQKIPHIWRRLAPNYAEVREHGAAWQTP